MTLVLWNFILAFKKALDENVKGAEAESRKAEAEKKKEAERVKRALRSSTSDLNSTVASLSRVGGASRRSLTEPESRGLESGREGAKEEEKRRG